jgi:16S rRNA (guanine527-N7)-methyltransferase
VLDVGSGAGLPGLPLKILRPSLKLSLLEATAKKVAFLEHICQELGLRDVEIITGRAEEIAHQPAYREQFDFVLARAVASLATLVELTLPFVMVGGSLIAPKRGDITTEVSEAAYAVSRLGGRLREIKTVVLDELPEGNELVIIDKTSPTPPAYPRRPGRPAKRPLAG